MLIFSDTMLTILKRLLLLIVLGPLIVVGQVEDDFSDGDIDHDPVWTGDLQLFTVNNYFQLQLNDVGAGQASLYTGVAIEECMEWRFWIRQAFSPSGNNNSRVYLSEQEVDTALRGKWHIHTPST